jgi:hypothetical protein
MGLIWELQDSFRISRTSCENPVHYGGDGHAGGAEPPQEYDDNNESGNPPYPQSRYIFAGV